MLIPVKIQEVQTFQDPPWSSVAIGTKNRVILSDGIHLITQKSSQWSRTTLKDRLASLGHDVVFVAPLEHGSRFASGLTTAGHVFVLHLESFQISLIQGLPEFMPNELPARIGRSQGICGCLGNHKFAHNFDYVQTKFIQSIQCFRVGEQLNEVLLILDYTIFHWTRSGSQLAHGRIAIMEGLWRHTQLDVYPNPILRCDASMERFSPGSTTTWTILVVYCTAHYAYAKTYLIRNLPVGIFQLAPERQIKIGEHLPESVASVFSPKASLIALAQNVKGSVDHSSVKILVPASNQIFSTELQGEHVSCLAFSPGHQCLLCLTANERFYILSRTGVLLMISVVPGHDGIQASPRPFFDFGTKSIRVCHSICFGPQSRIFISNGTQLWEVEIPREVDHTLDFTKLLLGRARSAVQARGPPRAKVIGTYDAGEPRSSSRFPPLGWKLQFFRHGLRDGLDLIKTSLNLLSHAIMETVIALETLSASRRSWLRLQRSINHLAKGVLSLEIDTHGQPICFRKWLRAVISSGKLDLGQNCVRFMAKLMYTSISTLAIAWPQDESLGELVHYLRLITRDFRVTFENVPARWIKRQIYVSGLECIYREVIAREEIPLLTKIQRYFQSLGHSLPGPRASLSSIQRGNQAFYQGQGQRAIHFWNQAQDGDAHLRIVHALARFGAFDQLVAFMDHLSTDLRRFSPVVEKYLELVLHVNGHEIPNFLDPLQALPPNLTPPSLPWFQPGMGLSVISAAKLGLERAMEFLGPFGRRREILALKTLQSLVVNRSSVIQSDSKLIVWALDEIIDIEVLPCDSSLQDLLGLLRIFPDASGAAIAIEERVTGLLSKTKEDLNNYLLINPPLRADLAPAILSLPQIRWIDWLFQLLKHLSRNHFETLIHSGKFIEFVALLYLVDSLRDVQEILPKCLDPLLCPDERNDNIYKILDIYTCVYSLLPMWGLDEDEGKTLSFLIAELPTNDLKANYLVYLMPPLRKCSSFITCRRLQRTMAEMKRIRVKIQDTVKSVEHWAEMGLTAIVEDRADFKQLVLKTQLRLRTLAWADNGPHLGHRGADKCLKTNGIADVSISQRNNLGLPPKVDHIQVTLHSKKGLFRSDAFLECQKHFFGRMTKDKGPGEGHRKGVERNTLWQKCLEPWIPPPTGPWAKLVNVLMDWLHSVEGGTTVLSRSVLGHFLEEFIDPPAISTDISEEIGTPRELPHSQLAESIPSDPQTWEDRRISSEATVDNLSVDAASHQSGIESQTDDDNLLWDLAPEPAAKGDVPVPKPRNVIPFYRYAEVCSPSNDSPSMLSTIAEVTEEHQDGSQGVPSEPEPSSLVPSEAETGRAIPNYTCASSGNETSRVIEIPADSDDTWNEANQDISNGGNILERLLAVPNFEPAKPEPSTKPALKTPLELDCLAQRALAASKQSAKNDGQVCKSKKQRQYSGLTLPSDELRLPPLLHWDREQGGGELENDMDDYFNEIVHFRSGPEERSSGMRSINGNVKPPQFVYKAGKYDHLLDEVPRRKKAFDEFADIQYAIRCSLNAALKQDQVEQIGAQHSDLQFSSAHEIDATMTAMKGDENAEANLQQKHAEAMKKAAPSSAQVECSHIKTDDGEVPQTKTETPPQASSLPELIQRSVGTEMELTQVDEAVQVDPPPLANDTYSLDHEEDRFLHSGDTLNSFSGSDEYATEDLDGSTAYEVEHSCSATPQGSGSLGPFSPENKLTPGDTSDEECSNTSKDVPTLPSEMEKDGSSPQDVPSPRISQGHPEPSSLSESNSFRVFCKAGLKADKTHQSLLTRANFLELLNEGLDHELVRSSKLLKTLSEVSRINETIVSLPHDNLSLLRRVLQMEKEEQELGKSPKVNRAHRPISEQKQWSGTSSSASLDVPIWLEQSQSQKSNGTVRRGPGIEVIKVPMLDDIQEIISQEETV